MALQAVLLLLLLVASLCGVWTCDNATAISSAVDLLLAEYDRGAGQQLPVPVGVGLDVLHASIDEPSSSIKMLADLYLNWEDKRLAWNATSWGCEHALVSAERLWLPDVALLSAARVAQGAGGGEVERARITSDGRVTWLVRMDIMAPLTLSLQDWPRDEHQAFFEFGSRSHSKDEIELNLSDLQHATVFESGMWELVGVHSTEALVARLDEAQQEVVWRVTLRRRAHAHVLAVRAMLVAAVLLLAAATLLPPTSRAPLCATATLVSALWLISSLVRLPGTSQAPRVLSVASALGACGAAAAVGAALVLRVARCSSPPPHTLRNLVTYTSVFCKLMPPEGRTAEWTAWAAAAQLLDRTLVAALALTLTILVCFILAI